MPQQKDIIISPRATERIAAAHQFLARLDPGARVLVIAASPEAGDDLIRIFAADPGALFGIERLTLNRLIALLAAPALVAAAWVPAAGLAVEAVAARTVFRLKDDPRVRHFAPIIDRPGFAGALARTLTELRLAGITPAALARAGDRCAALAILLERFADELREASLADRAEMIAVARAALENDSTCPFTGLPTLLLDVPVDSGAESELIRAVASRAASILATVPAGDTRSARFFEQALGIEPTRAAHSTPATSLERMQQHLFADTTPAPTPLDESVAVSSAAGEMQECVEIARRIHAEVRRGILLDRIAVLLHAPARYVPYLEEALNRAGIPAWFARGSSMPEPGGRAMLSLLACAAEGLSARRFAEYISLAQLPADAAEAASAPFTAADADLTAVPSAAVPEPAQLTTDPASVDPVPQVEGAMRAPWRWEQVLVEAAVVGGLERWESRLAGLAAELRLKRSELTEEDSSAAALERRLLDIEHLREVGLPIIAALAELPASALWGEWLARLRALAARTLRDAGAVLTALAELEPMAPVGPVTLEEVRLVLAERLGRLERPPARRRYGAVFVAPTSYMRGFAFDTVIVPGLAERVFPKKLVEDPLLPDSLREQLAPDLPTQPDQVKAERLALCVAAGAARQKVIFSYPRVDLDQGRPRVPSFYALEVLRAAEGRLPDFDELARRAAGDRVTRLGWPAPERPADAIDDIEFDLAVLDRLIDADPDTTVGAAHYLLDANVHLGRALRARGRRWLRRWTPNDGLVELTPEQKTALARHQLTARPYSATALQHFAACPYRFFLQAIVRLEPREQIEPLEVIDPLTRGALFHEVQFETLTALRAARLLPVRPANLAAAFEILERALEHVAANQRAKLAPAIERVWLDGIESIRADLREWMRRMAEDSGGFKPERFELAFGLKDREQADPGSSPSAIELGQGIRLRGSIDLIESVGDGRLRVTDHKTGRVRVDRSFIIQGGKTLQPVLYALAAERLLQQPVATGRLYYCTAAGSYEERVVALDAAAREAIGEFARIIGAALSDGFIPAAPDEGECRYCDYRGVCGPYEEQRVGRKLQGGEAKTRLAALEHLREIR